MFTVGIRNTLCTPIYPVYPCLLYSHCLPYIPFHIQFTHVYPNHTVYPVPLCILFTHVYPGHNVPLYILFTHVYLRHTVYPVYPYLPCLPMFPYISCIPCIPWYILLTHVYPTHTEYPVYPYISCVPLFTQLILYTLYTLVYTVYPCLPLSYCIPCIPLLSCLHMFTFVIPYTMYTLGYSFPLNRRSRRTFYAYDQSLRDTRRTFFLHVNDSISFVSEWLVRQGIQKLIFVTLPRLTFSLFFRLINPPKYTPINTSTVVQGQRGGGRGGGGWNTSPAFLICCSIPKQFYL